MKKSQNKKLTKILGDDSEESVCFLR